MVTALAKNAGTALMQPVALVCIGGPAVRHADDAVRGAVHVRSTPSRRELRKVEETDLQTLDI